MNKRFLVEEKLDLVDGLKRITAGDSVDLEQVELSQENETNISSPQRFWPPQQTLRTAHPKAKKPFLELIFNPDTALVTVDDDSPTISVLWDRAVQQAVINESPGPTVASRAYGIVHTAMFDAWAAYDPIAIATQLGDALQRRATENTVANKMEAMSYAAYRVLTELFPNQNSIFDTLMAELGFAPSNTTTDTRTAAGIGNISAEVLMAFRRHDGANQLGNDPNGNGTPYSDNSGYTPFNPVGHPIDMTRWTPETVPIDAEPGSELRIQEFLTPQWGAVTPFSLAAGDQLRPEAPEPFLVEDIEAEVDLDAKTITLADGTELPITADLVGDVINPDFVAQAQEIIQVSANLTDEQKLIAEFWEDGGGTSFPPGTWMTFGQFVSARDRNSLDADAQLFFALGNAVFDAGIATWEAKTFYDYVRPVRAIRTLGELGLVGEFDADLGGFAIDAWGGPGKGTQRMLATDFITYQTPDSDPSPPFAEYTSGHSAFSSAGAEILKLFTGSDAFGGSVTYQPGESLFEPGLKPRDATTLDWDTFTVAADEAGLSRIYGGIHFEDGDVNGRTLGRQVGGTVLDQTLYFINGGQAIHSITGTEGNNKLRGTKGDDRIVALGGKDILLGRKGNDRLLGGDDHDFLAGHAGNDRLSGGDGNDKLKGGKGADVLIGGAGRDYLVGGADNDLLLGGAGHDVLRGKQGQDTFILGTANGIDTVLDFNVDIDVIGLMEGELSFTDLDIYQQGGSTILGVSGAQGMDTLAILRHVKADQLTEDQFVTISDFSTHV